MTNNKHAFVSLLCLAILGSAGAIYVIARGGPEGLHRRGHTPPVSMSNDIVSRLTTKLSLTAEQQAEARKLVDAMQKEAVVVRADPKLTAEQKREKMRELMERARGDLKVNLRPDQVAQYDAIMAEMHGAGQSEKGH
jgi:hypothetical protein